MQADELSRFAHARVLIVEDNELNLMLLKDILEFHGYTIITTGLGGTALDLARQYHPDLVLMDIQLPDVSGIDAARQLKADAETHAIPIIAVTAFAMPGDKSKILEGGIDGYIAKPYRITEILDIAAEYLKRPTAERPADNVR
jgi:two-component system cell cycle response regulator DivK